MKRRARSLDQSLNGDRIIEPEVSGLVKTARELEDHFDVDAPESPRERALFVHAVGARGRPRRRGLLLPVMAGVVAIFVLGYAAGNALPGDRIYTVRKAMESVGLVSSASEQARSLLRDANGRVSDAESLVGRSPGRARALAFEAISLLEQAESFVEETPGSERTRFEDMAEELGDRAAAVIAFVATPQDDDGSDDNSGPGDDDDPDDSSGPGSGDADDADDADEDDSSGPGSGDDTNDDGDDSSGSGSGDDSDDGDSSGSGSGDSDDDVDSSGEGSGD